MYSLSFRKRSTYRFFAKCPEVEISLSVGDERVKLWANIDTGAEYCFFDRGYAEALSIDLAGRTPEVISTVAGQFRAYRHEVILAVIGIEVDALVFFYENHETKRNVLGRNGWLNRVRLGLVDHESLVYLSAYDD